ncbi:MAG: hypothetical protein ACX98W_11150 [bacterium]
MKNRRLGLAAVCTTTLLIGACTFAPPTQTQTPPETLKPASFDYSPPSTADAGSAGMTIILVNPSYAEDFAASGVEPYQTFGKRLADDFEEILAARGFTVYGPYRTYDEIVYSEKETADLVMLVDIEMEQSNSFKKSEKTDLASLILAAASSQSSRSRQQPIKRYVLSGKMGLTGRFTMKAREPQSGEQMWVKSLEIEPKQYAVQSTRPWTDEAINGRQFYQDPGIFNPTVDSLQVVYQDAMGKAFTYLEARELQALRPQIERIKQRIRY